MVLDWTWCTILILVFGFQVGLVNAAIVNRTIDDSMGDSVSGDKPIFLPSTGGVWEDQTCAGCAIQPDITKTFQNTFAAATYHPPLGSISIQFEFEGVAIWVYFTLANNNGEGVTTLTIANFSVDGGPPTFFQHTPDVSTTEILYKQLAFSRTDLSIAKHTMFISTSGNTDAYLNFDYAMYSYDDSFASSDTSTIFRGTKSSTAPSTSSTSSTNSASTSSVLESPHQKQASLAAIIGGSIGGVVAAVLIATLVICLIRSRRCENRRQKHGTLPDPFVLPVPGTMPGVPSNTNVHRPRVRLSSGYSSQECHQNPMAERSGPTTLTRSTTPTTGRSQTTSNSPISPDADPIRQERRRELVERMYRAESTVNGQAPVRATAQNHGQRYGPVISGESDRSPPDGGTIEEIREQLRQMTREMSTLRRQQQSSRPFVESNEPPPGYDTLR